MPTFETRRRVPFTPQQMYALVADVERYPEFLPLCEALVVKSRAPHGLGELLSATMRVGYGAFNEQFLTRVTLDPVTPRVLAEHVEGPFRHLVNRWQFHTIPGGTDVDFHISYELKSMLLAMVVGAMFDHAFRKYTEAFEMRARQVYGAPSSEM
jgi:coenzyme Q-binding protein COQ10